MYDELLKKHGYKPELVCGPFSYYKGAIYFDYIAKDNVHRIEINKKETK